MHGIGDAREIDADEKELGLWHPRVQRGLYACMTMERALAAFHLHLSQRSSAYGIRQTCEAERATCAGKHVREVVKMSSAEAPPSAPPSAEAPLRHHTSSYLSIRQHTVRGSKRMLRDNSVCVVASVCYVTTAGSKRMLRDNSTPHVTSWCAGVLSPMTASSVLSHIRCCASVLSHMRGLNERRSELSSPLLPISTLLSSPTYLYVT